MTDTQTKLITSISTNPIGASFSNVFYKNQGKTTNLEAFYNHYVVSSAIYYGDNEPSNNRYKIWIDTTDTNNQ